VAATALDPSVDLDDLRAQYRAFLDEHIVPVERVLDGEGDDADALIASVPHASAAQAES